MCWARLDQNWERKGERLAADYRADHTDIIDAPWEWVKERGMVDEEVDLKVDGYSLCWKVRELR